LIKTSERILPFPSLFNRKIIFAKMKPDITDIEQEKDVNLIRQWLQEGK